MDAHEDTPRIQVLSVSDTGRRRRWTDEEKIRIVEESRCEGMTLPEVARRHEISRSMLCDWRYRHKLGLLGAPVPFMRLFPMDSHTHAADVLSSTTPPPPVMTIDLGERLSRHDPPWASTWRLQRGCSMAWLSANDRVSGWCEGLDRGRRHRHGARDEQPWR